MCSYCIGLLLNESNKDILISISFDMRISFKCIFKMNFELQYLLVYCVSIIN